MKLLKKNTFIASLTLFSSTLPTIFADTIGWQAESFASQTSATSGVVFDIFSDVDALGGQYITTSSTNRNLFPLATYNIDADVGGTGYNLYIRYIAPDANSDSFRYPDAIGPSPTLNQLTGMAATSSTYIWSPSLTGYQSIPTYTLSAGQNSIVIGAREHGFLIDAFVLSTEEGLSDAQLDNAVLIPEPSTFIMIGLAGFALLFFRRRA